MANNQKSRTRKWSERDTIRFVEIYESEEVLWNQKLKNYKNKDARESALQRIIQNLGMPDLTTAEVLKKINNIRCTYTQEKAKEMETGSGVEDVYVSTLPWYDVAERFLSGVIKSRKTIEPDSQATQERENELHSEVPLPSNTSDVPEIPPSDVLPTDICSPYNSSLNDEEIFGKTPSTTNKKRKKNQIPLHIEKSIETLQSIKSQVLHNKEVEDEFTHFGKNVASQLRHLPIMEALDAQSEILELLKKKRQSIHLIHEQNSPSPNITDEAEYTIEVPEHVFNSLQQSQSRQDQVLIVQDSPLPNIEMSEYIFNSLQSQLHNNIELTTNSRKSVIEEAIKSIGGVPTFQN